MPSDFYLSDHYFLNTNSPSTFAPHPVDGQAPRTPLSERLKYLTLAGINQNVQIGVLHELAMLYPFAEFGVLFSNEKCGQGRYPSLNWISDLAQELRLNPGLRVALHVCGSAVGDLVDGTSKMVPVLQHFSRVQLNFTHSRYPLSSVRRLLKINPETTFITQFSPRGSDLWTNLADLPNHDVLFGASGGFGSTARWPEPLDRPKAGLLQSSAYIPMCGYSGGLGPDNLKRRLRAFALLTKNSPFWIGLESSLRVNDKFDLVTAMRCLDVTQAVLQKEAAALAAAKV